ncbi:hypothetical protein XH79_14030 [Bradyrhizobium sp. CCBAU 45389]|nr:hypothetical protein [Bradyrhizobium sp. CCBAU 45389]
MLASERGMEINWRSEQGKRTRDNRDCGGVGVRADAVLFLLNVVDWYVATDEAATIESLSA